MNLHRRLLPVVLLLAMLVTGSGCGPRSITLEPTQLVDWTPLLQKDLLYLGSDGGRHLLVDPDGNRTYALGDADAGLISGLTAFTEVSFRADARSKAVFRSAVVPPVRRNVPVVAAANDKEATQLYPAALMDHLLYSSYSAEHAIEAYTVKSAKVVSSEGRRTTIEFVADLKPVNDAFAHVRSRWGSPAADGYVHDTRLVLNLYRNGGLYCTYKPDWWDIFSEGAPPVAQTPAETLYKPVVYENMWQALSDGHDVEQVIWEDDVYSYITHVRLSGNRLGQQYYDMTIYRIERDSADRLALFDVLRDTFEVRPLGLRGSTLYLQAGKAFPYSEAYSGPVASLDLATGEYSVLLTEQTALLGKVVDTVYIAKLAGPDSQRQGGIYGLNVSTGELRRVSDLPGSSFSTGV